MNNSKSAMLALLMCFVSTLAIAAEPHHDAHDANAKPIDAEPAAAASLIKPEVTAPAATEARPAFKKKKSRISKALVATKKTAHAASAHQNPVQPTVSHAEHPTQSTPAIDTSRTGNSEARVVESYPAAIPESVHAESSMTAKPDGKPEVLAEQASAAVSQVTAETNTPAKIPAVTEALTVVETQDSAPVIEVAATCKLPSKREIAALFDRWNAALKTGDAKKVVANYATPSILLPTVSNQARFTAAEKEDYFVHFLQRKPEGKIDDRLIEVDCNSATDAGLYSFKFADGSVVKARYSFSYKKVDDLWLISSHHSSAMPEKAVTEVNQQSQAAAVITQERVEVAPRNSGWIRFP